MPNFRKKINRLAPMVISAGLLICLSTAVYGLDGSHRPPYYDNDDEYTDTTDDDDYWYGDEDPDDTEDTTEEDTGSSTSTYYPPFTTTTTTTTTAFSYPPFVTSRTTTTFHYYPPVTSTTTPYDPPTTTTPPTSDSEDTTTPPSSDTDDTDISDTEPTDTSNTPNSSDTEPIVDPPRIYLSFSERWLTVGDGTQLSAEVVNTEEYYPVSFVSSNTSVVRVDASGYIIAVGAGSAVVTAYSGELEAYAYVYVSEPPVVPEFIVLNESNFLLKIDQTVHIQARLLPEEAAEGYYISYTSNDTSVAVVDENGVITAIGEGETTIMVEGAGLYETVYVTVSSDIAYETARLDGYLYGNSGKPISGSHLVIDGLSAITDKDGYFVFDNAEQRSLTIRLEDDPNAYCGLTVSGNTTVYLLYDSDTLTRLSSYDELAGRLTINSVNFISSNIVLTAGEVYELAYQYEPSDATVTGISYSSSNSLTAVVGQVDGIVTAKSPGEATIILTLNNGQAQAICTITVNPKESSEHSVLIIAIEAVIFVVGAAAVLLTYRRYRLKALSTLDEDEDEEDEGDLHDID